MIVDCRAGTNRSMQLGLPFRCTGRRNSKGREGDKGPGPVHLRRRWVMHEKSPAPLGFRRPAAPSWPGSSHRGSEPKVAAGAAAKSTTVTLIGSRVPAACASLSCSTARAIGQPTVRSLALGSPA